MRDLVDCIALRPILEERRISPDQNFEDVFSGLYRKQEFEKAKKIVTLILG